MIAVPFSNKWRRPSGVRMRRDASSLSASPARKRNGSVTVEYYMQVRSEGYATAAAEIVTLDLGNLKSA
jgi:hypothetical protein